MVMVPACLLLRLARLLMVVLHFYSSPTEILPVDVERNILRSGKHHVERIEHIYQEFCFNVNWTGSTSPSPHERHKLTWIFQSPFNSQSISTEPFLSESDGGLLVEIGPRLNFSTAWSTNAVSMCQAIGLTAVDRIECSRRYLLKVYEEEQLGAAARSELMAAFYDRMTECVYEQPIETFLVSAKPAEVYEVDVVNRGKRALEKANWELGLAFDAWDLEYYTRLFEKMGRNPSSVECFDLAQSNSGMLVSCFVKNSLLSEFDLLHSAITGRAVTCLYPNDQSRASKVDVRSTTRHVIFTAETHNFPTGVAPFSGATTGTGGRIRDIQCTGRGAHAIAGTAGYCFGNLLCPGYPQPWEDQTFIYPGNFARPLEVAIEASNGASDYGNKFGEPVLAGFARSFGMLLPGQERREWVKPVMFSAGIGTIEDQHIDKEQPKPEMEVVKIGGPVYRIGVGGGAASSIQVQGDNTEELDFGAVQRGDAEMEQKMNRVLRACIECEHYNPICSIHDQGAGGNGNVLKELSDPAGATIYTSKFKVGDPTLSVLELWGAEYQETNALLMRSKDSAFLRAVCGREKCPVDFVGKITGDGKIVLVDDRNTAGKSEVTQQSATCPVDLKLEWVLGKMPQKEFTLEHRKPSLQPLSLPTNLTVRDALNRVLRLPSVASKRYLTNKVDRSVTGLVAQQQCVGPLHTPLADVAVIALSYFDTVGAATAIGEQPIKGLIDPGAGARMAIGEALTNLVFARVTELRDVKCSANWMWPAKLPGEGAALYDACQAMCLTLSELGIAVDGGKDSLSMAARVGQETVKAPGSLVISVYAVCPDITCTVTPDLKNPHGQGVLLYVPVTPGQHRMGGGALAQCYSQIGNECPDMDSPQQLASCFTVTQQLLKERSLSAGHDVSDGGLLTCLLEMAIAGNCGMELNISDSDTGVIELLFSEELGLVLEVPETTVDKVQARYRASGLQCWRIGSTTGQGPQSMVKVQVNGEEVLSERTATLRSWWEETSFRLERLQSNRTCVEEEERAMEHRIAPKYKLSFQPAHQPSPSTGLGLSEPRVAVIREEGSNGDREMVASLIMAGFEVWDVTMTDICSGMTLDSFHGVVFVGGFSFADVLGSAKGWAATVQFNPAARAEFSRFRSRQDTFSLGVCNGCQLMALLGWVASDVGLEMLNDAEMRPGVVLTHNKSGRFESRFVTVTVLESSSVLLQGMEGSALGIWVAHGEGYMQFESETVLRQVTEGNLAPLRYCDDSGIPTERYPQNPNGSPLGIAALCSADGRHLAMMPHPERCTLLWQWPWMPQDWQQSLTVSPWLRMFQNAHQWCLQSL
ncbi:phosphoribosylformylglycinamidine synthase [Scyliorhinus canicula]|uniref:phosphoribosylformylglycinamidine synthase n=1 Tax=Scyliorhinus canicula TaxID=7830 RepID=UPI0018F67182|nr:phosphoribosylformylglycinamidine synthase [Scyliorhinus canicula]